MAPSWTCSKARALSFSLSEASSETVLDVVKVPMVTTIVLCPWVAEEPEPEGWNPPGRP